MEQKDERDINSILGEMVSIVGNAAAVVEKFYVMQDRAVAAEAENDGLRRELKEQEIKYLDLIAKYVMRKAAPYYVPGRQKEHFDIYDPDFQELVDQLVAAGRVRPVRNTFSAGIYEFVGASDEE